MRPTVKEQELLRVILRHAADIADTVEHADGSGWVVDSTELVEYVMSEVDRVNDALMALILEQTKEDTDNAKD